MEKFSPPLGESSIRNCSLSISRLPEDVVPASKTKTISTTFCIFRSVCRFISFQDSNKSECPEENKSSTPMGDLLSADSICNIKAANLVNGSMKSWTGEIFQSLAHSFWGRAELQGVFCAFRSAARGSSHFGEMVMNGRISFRSAREPPYKSPLRLFGIKAGTTSIPAAAATAAHPL